MRDIKKYTKKEFVNECVKRFGSDPLKWAFECPWCGLKQTAQDFVTIGVGKTFKDAWEHIGFTCIGKWKTDTPKEKFSQIIGAYKNYKGCSYSCAMTFQHHSIEMSYVNKKGIWIVREFFDFAKS